MTRLLGLRRTDRPSVLEARGGYTIWRERWGRWRWAATWRDDDISIQSHGAGRSLLAVCRSVRRHARLAAEVARK